jgi:Pentapeptide repeats (8 copies)
MENLSDVPNLPGPGEPPPRLSNVSLNDASLNDASLNDASLNDASLNDASLNDASLNAALPTADALAPAAALGPALQALAQNVQELAQQATGSSTQLLALLRVLESLHREICEGAFQQSLPNTRQTLYSLLRDIEAQGGWPHIPRIKLQRLLAALESAEPGSEPEPDGPS